PAEVDAVRAGTDELIRGTIPALAYVQDLLALDRHGRNARTIVAAGVDAGMFKDRARWPFRHLPSQFTGAFGSSQQAGRPRDHRRWRTARIPLERQNPTIPCD